MSCQIFFTIIRCQSTEPLDKSSNSEDRTIGWLHTGLKTWIRIRYLFNFYLEVFCSQAVDLTEGQANSLANIQEPIETLSCVDYQSKIIVRQASILIFLNSLRWVDKCPHWIDSSFVIENSCICFIHSTQAEKFTVHTKWL